MRHKHALPAPEVPPPRRAPETALPLYRFVPGLNPHPFRHPDGHMYTDGSAPPQQPWTPAVTAYGDPLFLYAADLFDHRFYWEAHEAWECMWHSAKPRSLHSDLLQSLIQCAASVLQGHMAHARGARALLHRAHVRLEPWITDRGELLYGVDVGALFRDIIVFLDGGAWPRISLVKP